MFSLALIILVVLVAIGVLSGCAVVEPSTASAPKASALPDGAGGGSIAWGTGQALHVATHARVRVSARLFLSNDDYRRFGVRSRGMVRVQDDGAVAVTFTPCGDQGAVVLNWVDYGNVDLGYIASAAPCILARAVLDESELARAAAAPDSRGDAAHSRGVLA